MFLIRRGGFTPKIPPLYTRRPLTKKNGGIWPDPVCFPFRPIIRFTLSVGGQLIKLLIKTPRFILYTVGHNAANFNIFTSPPTVLLYSK